MDIKLKNSSNESLNITGGNVNIQNDVSVNGSISEGGTLLSLKYQSTLSMANENIQITGSQLGLNSSLTGISSISGSTVTISAGSTVNLSGSNLYIKNTGSTGSININQSGASASTNYLWGSTIVRSSGVKLATETSNTGCTMQYNPTTKAIDFNF
jgi:hypothetical protein